MPRGRPKGSVNKEKEMEVKDVKVYPSITIAKPMEVEAKPEVKNEAKEESKKEETLVLTNKCKLPHLPNCQCRDQLGAGQAYFEDGPTGTHIIGDDNKGQIWFRAGNNGKGCFINKKR